MTSYLVPAKFHLTPEKFRAACPQIAHHASILSVVAISLFTQELPDGQTEEDAHHLIFAYILFLARLVDPNAGR